MKNVITGFIIFILVNAAYAAETETLAPFGLHWGESKQKLNKSGVVFEKCITDRELSICTTKKPIKPVSFGDIYQLVIDSKRGLQKVAMLSNDITDDITGSEGKELYAKVKSSLIKKYGEAKDYEYSGWKIYDEYDEFYQCLAYPGCGSWLSYWEPQNGGTVSVSLKGIGRGKGYLKITYESKKWAVVVNERKKKESSYDESAL